MFPAECYESFCYDWTFLSVSCRGTECCFLYSVPIAVVLIYTVALIYIAFSQATNLKTNFHDVRTPSKLWFDRPAIHPSNIFYAFNDSIDAFAYKYDAVAEPPPYWAKLSRQKLSFSVIYKHITKRGSCMSCQHNTYHGHSKNVYLHKIFF